MEAVKKEALADDHLPDSDRHLRRALLPKGRIYHFNVIYNHAQTPLARTDDTSLSLAWTNKAVESLQLLGMVNSYYHDRDCPTGSSLVQELSRVLAGSEVTVIVLSPGFVRDCWPRYVQLTCFKNLFGISTDSLSDTSYISSTRFSSAYSSIRYNSGSKYKSITTVTTSPKKMKMSSQVILVALNVEPEKIPNGLQKEDVLFFQRDWQNDQETWQRFMSAALTALPNSADLQLWNRLDHSTKQYKDMSQPKVAPSDINQNFTTSSMPTTYKRDEGRKVISENSQVRPDSHFDLQATAQTTSDPKSFQFDRKNTENFAVRPNRSTLESSESDLVRGTTKSTTDNFTNPGTSPKEQNSISSMRCSLDKSPDVHLAEMYQPSLGRTVDNDQMKAHRDTKSAIAEKYQVSLRDRTLQDSSHTGEGKDVELAVLVRLGYAGITRLSWGSSGEEDQQLEGCVQVENEDKKDNARNEGRNNRESKTEHTETKLLDRKNTGGDKEHSDFKLLDEGRKIQLDSNHKIIFKTPQENSHITENKKDAQHEKGREVETNSAEHQARIATEDRFGHIKTVIDDAKVKTEGKIETKYELTMFRSEDRNEEITKDVEREIKLTDANKLGNNTDVLTGDSKDTNINSFTNNSQKYKIAIEHTTKRTITEERNAGAIASNIEQLKTQVSPDNNAFPALYSDKNSSSFRTGTYVDYETVSQHRTEQISTFENVRNEEVFVENLSILNQTFVEHRDSSLSEDTETMKSGLGKISERKSSLLPASLSTQSTMEIQKSQWKNKVQNGHDQLILVKPDDSNAERLLQNDQRSEMTPALNDNYRQCEMTNSSNVEHVHPPENKPHGLILHQNEAYVSKSDHSQQSKQFTTSQRNSGLFIHQQTNPSVSNQSNVSSVHKELLEADYLCTGPRLQPRTVEESANVSHNTITVETFGNLNASECDRLTITSIEDNHHSILFDTNHFIGDAPTSGPPCSTSALHWDHEISNDETQQDSGFHSDGNNFLGSGEIDHSQAVEANFEKNNGSEFNISREGRTGGQCVRNNPISKELTTSECLGVQEKNVVDVAKKSRLIRSKQAADYLPEQSSALSSVVTEMEHGVCNREVSSVEISIPILTVVDQPTLSASEEYKSSKNYSKSEILKHTSVFVQTDLQNPVLSNTESQTHLSVDVSQFCSTLDVDDVIAVNLSQGKVDNPSALVLTNSRFSRPVEIQKKGWTYSGLDERPQNLARILLPLYRMIVYMVTKPEMPYF